MSSRGDRVSKSNQLPKLVLPGDRLASIEEFEAGEGTAISAESVVAARIGQANVDMSKRTVGVIPLKKSQSRLPVPGDTVIGVIDSASNTVAQVTIKAVGEVESSKELSGMLYLREDRRFKSGPFVRAADIIRAKVTSTVNAIYHLSFDCPNCGVLFTACSNCGGRVVALSKGRVKCRECGNVEDRSLSEDFVEFSRNEVNY